MPWRRSERYCIADVEPESQSRKAWGGKSLSRPKRSIKLLPLEVSINYWYPQPKAVPLGVKTCIAPIPRDYFQDLLITSLRSTTTTTTYNFIQLYCIILLYIYICSYYYTVLSSFLSSEPLFRCYKQSLNFVTSKLSAWSRRSLAPASQGSPFESLPSFLQCNPLSFDPVKLDQS